MKQSLESNPTLSEHKYLWAQNLTLLFLLLKPLQPGSALYSSELRVTEEQQTGPSLSKKSFCLRYNRALAPTHAGEHVKDVVTRGS